MCTPTNTGQKRQRVVIFRKMKLILKPADDFDSGFREAEQASGHFCAKHEYNEMPLEKGPSIRCTRQEWSAFAQL